MPILGFTISDSDLRLVLSHMLRMVALWLVAVGVLLIAMPARRYGAAWHFIMQTPIGDDGIGAIFAILGALLMWSLYASHQRVMAYSLLIGGLMNWVLGVGLLVGSVLGPTGVIGAPFCLYVGGHMLLLSVLLSKHRAPSGV